MRKREGEREGEGVRGVWESYKRKQKFRVKSYRDKLLNPEF